MEDQPGIANIQNAVLEYRATFKEPIAELWYGGRQGEIISSLQRALSPWAVGLENVTWQQAPKNLGEVQLTFAIPSMVATLQIGVGGAVMTAINPDWSRVSQLISLFQTGAESIVKTTGREFQFQQATLGFHIQPSGKGFRETLGRFVNASALGCEDAQMFGVSVYYSDFLFVIDKSVMFPEGVFVRLIRTFSPPTRLDEMATILHKDEETVLSKLGLRLE